MVYWRHIPYLFCQLNWILGLCLYLLVHHLLALRNQHFSNVLAVHVPCFLLSFYTYLEYMTGMTGLFSCDTNNIGHIVLYFFFCIIYSLVDIIMNLANIVVLGLLVLFLWTFQPHKLLSPHFLSFKEPYLLDTIPLFMLPVTTRQSKSSVYIDLGQQSFNLQNLINRVPS